MQTKLDRGGAFIPDDPQFWLYDDWPPFAVRSPGFDSRDRHFGGDRRSGCYGLVSTAGWWVMPPVSPMTAAAPECVSLAGFLVDMLYDMDPAQPYRRSETGRQVYHNSTKDWSVTIMELIQITGLRAFRHMGKKVGLYPGPMSRIGGGVFFMTLKDRYSNGNAFDEDGEGPVEEGRGFGVLVIETDAFDERKG